MSSQPILSLVEEIVLYVVEYFLEENFRGAFYSWGNVEGHKFRPVIDLIAVLVEEIHRM